MLLPAPRFPAPYQPLLSAFAGVSHCQLIRIATGMVDMMEAEVDLTEEAPQVEEVIIEPPNQRERVGNLGLKRKAAISTIPEMCYFGLAEVMSKQARLRHTDVCSVPTDIISINKEDARKMMYSGWLATSSSDLERMEKWHSARLDFISHTRETVDKIWGFVSVAQDQVKPPWKHRESAFATMTRKLWGNPAGQLGLPIISDKFPDPTPKIKAAVMKSSYAEPNKDDLVSATEALLVASMRVRLK